MFGQDSFVGTSRFYKTTFADVASFLALDYDEETIEKLQLEKFVLNDMVKDDRGLIAF